MRQNTGNNTPATGSSLDTPCPVHVALCPYRRHYSFTCSSQVTSLPTAPHMWCCPLTCSSQVALSPSGCTSLSALHRRHCTLICLSQEALLLHMPFTRGSPFHPFPPAQHWSHTLTRQTHKMLRLTLILWLLITESVTDIYTVQYICIYDQP